MMDIGWAIGVSVQCIALFCAAYVTLIELARPRDGYGPVDVRTAAAASIWALFYIALRVPWGDL